MYIIQPIDEEKRKAVIDFVTNNWGAPIIVTKGKVHYLDKLPGFVAIDNGNISGLITYQIDSMECEIVSLNSMLENRGVGSLLLKYVIMQAKEKSCKRVWLITTNDNTRAIRFYQKRGFDMKSFYRNEVLESRKIKPEIPLLGYDNIPILHEIEFEMIL